MTYPLSLILDLFSMSKIPAVAFLQVTIIGIGALLVMKNYTSIRNFLLKTKTGLWWTLLVWFTLGCLFFEEGIIYWAFAACAVWFAVGLAAHHTTNSQLIWWCIPMPVEELDSILGSKDPMHTYCAGLMRVSNKNRNSELDLGDVNVYIQLPYWKLACGTFRSVDYKGVLVTSRQIRVASMLNGVDSLTEKPIAYDSLGQKFLRLKLKCMWTLPTFSITEFLETN